jgi:hypothetical protein
MPEISFVQTFVNAAEGQSSRTSMPISSRASQNYLQILSLRSRLNFPAHLRVQKRHQAPFRHLYCQAGSPCPSPERRYAAAASRAQTNGLSHGPSNFTRTFTDQAPDNPSRVSASGAKKAFRTTQMQLLQKKQESKNKNSQDSPDAVERTGDIFVPQGGIDRWANMDVDLLGAFGYLIWSSTPCIWYPTLIHLRKLDVELPVRNDLPLGLNKIKYLWDNSLNIAKSAVGYVSFCHLLQFFIVYP